MEITEKINQFIPIAEQLPGVVVIHRIEKFAPLYMSSNGLKLLGISLKELIDLGGDYQKKFFNEEFMPDFVELLTKMMKENNDDQTYTLFHQVQLKEKWDYEWYASSLKIFHRNSRGYPTHAITIANPLGELKHIPEKAERMLKETLFYKKNQKKFKRLGERAKEVLRLVALGKTSAEIAEELHVTVDTVNTHKRLVKEKLEISSSYQFMKYARSFDLI